MRTNKGIQVFLQQNKECRKIRKLNQVFYTRFLTQTDVHTDTNRNQMIRWMITALEREREKIMNTKKKTESGFKHAFLDTDKHTYRHTEKPDDGMNE